VSSVSLIKITAEILLYKVYFWVLKNTNLKLMTSDETNSLQKLYPYIS
jgi:hypothetical protein